MRLPKIIITILHLDRRDTEINRLKKSMANEALKTSKAIYKMNKVIVKSRDYYILKAMGVIEQ